jgi:sensor c-di-GMP phosphodiesterase-like protein
MNSVHGPLQESGTLSSKRLGAPGIDLAIDGFGSGYSSFGYLLKLPRDALK